jgi:hypothetical protein
MGEMAKDSVGEEKDVSDLTTHQFIIDGEVQLVG